MEMEGGRRRERVVEEICRLGLDTQGLQKIAFHSHYLLTRRNGDLWTIWFPSTLKRDTVLFTDKTIR